MIASMAMPSDICQTLGAYWLATVRSASKIDGGEERRQHVAGAAEDGDEHELAGGGPVGGVRVDVADRERRERAAQAGERRGDHVVDVDDAVDRGAEYSTRSSLSRIAAETRPQCEPR